MIPDETAVPAVGFATRGKLGERVRIGKLVERATKIPRLAVIPFGRYFSPHRRVGSQAATE